MFGLKLKGIYGVHSAEYMLEEKGEECRKTGQYLQLNTRGSRNMI